MEHFGFVASLTMGIVLGVMGGGGSILTIPILVYLFTLTPMVATGYSLFVVGTTSLIGSVMYLRKGDVDFQVGLAFAFPSVLGVNISRALIIPRIPDVIFQMGHFSMTKEVLIMLTFAALMIAASYSMIKKKNEQKTLQAHPIIRITLISLMGIIIGMIAGFVGAGGGFLIIPALVFMAGLSMRIAIGTSLMIITLQSLLGFAGDISRGLLIDWSLLMTVTSFAVVGILLGSAVAHRIEEQKLKPAFGWLILIMGIGVLVEQLRHFSV